MPYRYNLIESKHYYQIINELRYLNGLDGGQYDSKPIHPFKLRFMAIGSGESDRIGNKIDNVQLRLEYNINLSSYKFQLLPSTLSTSSDNQFFMKFRVMVIDIPDEDNLSNETASNYFKDMYTYLDSTNAQSIHTTSLRVSGPHTSGFRIIHDKMYTIKQTKPFIHEIANLKLANVLKFADGGLQSPENHNFYIWFCMPKYYLQDMSYNVVHELNNLINEPIRFSCNCKVTYQDS